MIAHRFRRCRLILVILGNITALVGVLLIRQLHTSNKGGRFAGTLLLVASTNSFPLLLSLVSSNTGGFTKKATVNAFFFVGYCVGNIAGPQLFVQKEAPTYSVRTGLPDLSLAAWLLYLPLFRQHLPAYL